MTYSKFERLTERLYSRMLREQSELLGAGAVRLEKDIESTIFEGDSYKTQFDFVEELYSKVNEAMAILNKYSDVVILSKSVELENKRIGALNALCEMYKKVGDSVSYMEPFDVFTKAAKARKNLAELQELLESKKLSTNVDVPEELAKYFDEYAN